MKLKVISYKQCTGSRNDTYYEVALEAITDDTTLMNVSIAVDELNADAITKQFIKAYGKDIYYKKNLDTLNKALEAINI